MPIFRDILVSPRANVTLDNPFFDDLSGSLRKTHPMNKLIDRDLGLACSLMAR